MKWKRPISPTKRRRYRAVFMVNHGFSSFDLFCDDGRIFSGRRPCANVFFLLQQELLLLLTVIMKLFCIYCAYAIPYLTLIVGVCAV